MPEAMVIDLSHWNSIPDSLVPAREAGIIGVIHKATEGSTNVDDKMRARHFLAKEAKMLWGLYHFLRPGSITDQVDHFLRVSEPFMDENTILVADHEDVNVPLAKLQVFLNTVKNKTGKTPLIYSGHLLKEQLFGAPNQRLSCFPLWLAQYGPKAELPPGWVEYFLWQYSQEGQVAGIDGDCDVNQGKDRDTIDRLWRFYAGGRKPGPTPPGPSVVKVLVPPGVKVVIDTYYPEGEPTNGNG